MKTNKKTIGIISLLIITTMVFITMCKHDGIPLYIKKAGIAPKDTTHTTNPPPVNPPGPIYGSSHDTIKDSICFAEEILPIIISNCANKPGCHTANAGGEPNALLNYSDVMQYVHVGNPPQSNLYQSITGNGQDIMPPYGNTTLTAAQIQLIYNWILPGAKNNIDCGMGCDTTVFTYSGAINVTLQNYCIGCHSGSSPSGNVSLVTYSNVVTVVNNGKLWGSINQLIGYHAMPVNGNKLDNCRIRQIKKWINAGALNN